MGKYKGLNYLLYQFYHWFHQVKDLLKQIKINAYYSFKCHKETVHFAFPISIRYDRGRFKPWRIFRIYIYILCFCITISYDGGLGKRNMFV